MRDRGVQAPTTGVGRRVTRRALAGPKPADIGFSRRFVVAAAMGSVLNPINSSIIAIALVAIGRQFGVGAGRTGWLVSGLYLATAVGQPTAGRLADRVGPRRVYLAGLALVGAGGLLGYLAPGLPALIAARVVIGAGTSAAYPAAMALVRQQSQRLDRPTPSGVLGALAVASQASMAIGPPLGGALIAFVGWRSIFLVNLPLVMMGVTFAMLWLPAAPRRALRSEPIWRVLDPLGGSLFVTALGALFVYLMHPRVSRWYLVLLVMLLATGLVLWERRTARPFIDVRMLARNPALLATYGRYAMTFLVTYGFIYGWTQWLEQSVGMGAASAGILLLPMSVVGAVVSAVATRIKLLRVVLATGAGTLAMGCIGLLFLAADTATWGLLAISAVFGIQNGLNVVGNQTAMYRQSPAADTGTAAGLLRTSQYLGAVLSASLISLTYGQRATDAGLHHLAGALLVPAGLVILGSLLGRGVGAGRRGRGTA